MLTTLLAEPRPDSRPVRARRTPVLLAVAATVVVALGAVVGVRVLPVVATPPGCGTTQAPDAATLLRALADCAQAQPVPEGAYDYVRYRVMGGGFVRGGPLEGFDTRESERWIAADGSGSWRLNGSDGSAQLVPLEPTDRGWGEWPADLGELEALIRADEEADMKYVRGDWMSAISLNANRIATPQVQASLLRLLATEDGLTIEGPVTDRAGRPGVAVSGISEGWNPYVKTRDVLIIDPATGMTLGNDTFIIEAEPGALTTPLPALWSYALVLDTGRVNSMTERPNR
ncbi:CU044_5270 family protein [Pseudonocardia sp. TRM90224]|uniref:CU044_5270 family protein n=1 Tax=Pseudonocardia sp. TRM90224 TaxID=2812678 RepID=UPI001E4A0677|nr:CU044_5270 family protein [Pseudonocardia sp. TRM90224]